MAEASKCVRCARQVTVSAEQYETLERMHYVCFHYEYEHDRGARDGVDVDADCGLLGCPSGVLPVAYPGPEAQQALKEAADGLRRPHDPEGWVIEFESSGVLSLRRPGHYLVRLVAVDYVEPDP